MNGPQTNFELGKIRHQEYEAEIYPYWGQDETGWDKMNVRQRLVLGLGSITLGTLMIVQTLVR